MSGFPLYQVDAFASDVLSGNPAAVMPLDRWLPEALMQRIAAENSVSETAFFVRNGGHYEIRWFSPAMEVPLCGHATLGSAWVIFNHLDPAADSITFRTRTMGDLTVRRDATDPARLVMDFPVTDFHPSQTFPELEAVAGTVPQSVWAVRAADFLLVLDGPEAVRDFAPKIDRITTLGRNGVFSNGMMVTAAAPGGVEGPWGCDFVCRNFQPGRGVPEDPVTGSMHTFLVPFWRERLGKDVLVSRQLSKRGGTLYCRDLGERIEIAGYAVPFLVGTCSVPVF